MPRRHDGLFEQIATFGALIKAARRALKGKRKMPGAARFMANLETECLRLERRLLSGGWTPGAFTSFRIHDPKPRLISAAPFQDRVVHHALCHVIQPIFERGFIDDTYANRVDKGTHRALTRFEHYRDRYRYVLRADIFRFFPAIDHEILKRDLRRRIACAPTLALCDRIIDGSNPQEPVELRFPGDDLLAPVERKRGLPIGNLTSQLFHNIYLDPMDHFIKEVLRAPGYVRYVDDFAIFTDEQEKLLNWRQRIGRFLEGRRLRLHERKTRITSSKQPAHFLGYVTMPGRRRLPEENLQRFRRRLRSLRDRWRYGSVTPSEVEQRVGAWIAHAEHTDSWRLRHDLFKGGWFDPALKPDRPQVRPGDTGRFLEQQTREPSLRHSQQEPTGQPEQQHRVSFGQHASMPERSGSRTRAARR